jgi:hypothetical protein
MVAKVCHERDNEGHSKKKAKGWTVVADTRLYQVAHSGEIREKYITIVEEKQSLCLKCLFFFL